MSKSHSLGVTGCNLVDVKSSNALTPDKYVQSGTVDEVERYHLYKQFLGKINANVEMLHKRLVSGMFSGLCQFLITAHDQPQYGKQINLPTAAIITGVNNPDHCAMYEHLIQCMINNATRHIAVLTCRECATLKGAMVKLLTDVINTTQDGGDDDRERTVSGHTLNMLTLCSWYKSNGAGKPVVVLIQEVEKCNAKVLHDIITILSKYLKEVPFILLLDIATSLHSLHNMLPYSVLSLLHIHKFRCQKSSDYFSAVLDQLVYSNLCPFKLGGDVIHVLVEQFIYFDFSIHNAVAYYQSCMLEHYLSSPVSILCCDIKDLDKYIAQLSSEHLRHIRLLPSFQKYCEVNYHADSILVNRYKYNDDKLKELLKSELPLVNKYHSYYVTALRCLLLASTSVVGMPLGNKLREVYLMLIGPSSEFLKLYDQTIQQLRCLDKDDLYKFIDGTVSELVNSALEFSDIVTQLNTYKSQLCDIGNISVSKVGEAPAAGKPLTATTLHDLQHSLRSKVRSRYSNSGGGKPLTPYESCTHSITSFLSQHLFRVYLRDPERCLFHEVYYYNDPTFIKHQLLTALPEDINGALTNPHLYLHDGNAESTVVPDICLAYKLYREHSKLININDWMQSFMVLLLGKENIPEGDERCKKAMVRFLKAISCLQHMGYTKPISKRKDHVRRLKW